MQAASFSSLGPSASLVDSRQIEQIEQIEQIDSSSMLFFLYADLFTGALLRLLQIQTASPHSLLHDDTMY